MKLVFAVWLLFLITISLMPLPLKIQLGTIGRLHQAGHFFAFLVTVFLLCKELKGLPGKIGGCLGALGLALLIEGLETVFYHNDFEWKDVATDASGITAGLILVTLVILSEQKTHTSPRADS